MQSKKYYQLMIPHAAQLHSTKPELRFCAGSNPTPSVSGIRQKYLSKIGNKKFFGRDGRKVYQINNEKFHKETA